MHVYRVQAISEPGDETPWTNQWLPTLALARKNLAEVEKLGWEARLDKINVPAGRDGLCYVLNLADANHTNLEGELIARV